MMDDGLCFSLVPKKPSLERHFGQSGLGTLGWSFARKRSLGSINAKLSF
jgi:hypothetical protein